MKYSSSSARYLMTCAILEDMLPYHSTIAPLDHWKDVQEIRVLSHTHLSIWLNNEQRQNPWSMVIPHGEDQYQLLFWKPGACHEKIVAADIRVQGKLGTNDFQVMKEFTKMVPGSLAWWTSRPFTPSKVWDLSNYVSDKSGGFGAMWWEHEVSRWSNNTFMAPVLNVFEQHIEHVDARCAQWSKAISNIQKNIRYESLSGALSLPEHYAKLPSCLVVPEFLMQLHQDKSAFFQDEQFVYVIRDKGEPKDVVMRVMKNVTSHTYDAFPKKTSRPQLGEQWNIDWTQCQAIPTDELYKVLGELNHLKAGVDHFLFKSLVEHFPFLALLDRQDFNLAKTLLVHESNQPNVIEQAIDFNV